ncbi:Kelch repeat-containing protein [Paenibacillus curdlanolyticus YK9]|uniref:Kelch repeat-containing protein n=1 Tax=Paenibacillus curdlanolyticus YK9 TaxID=717606 RepID=E0I5P4_9BACL|nr:hypothetical protein [Paenibacillus curdlanolyticus]EFM12286.1 Kelch repeat-containing protein [Paenibacillus curdlanolyticus YK9]
MTDAQVTVDNVVLSSAYQAWMLRLAFPTASAVEIAQEIKSIYSVLTAAQVAQWIKYGAPTPVFPDMSALDIGTLLLQPSLYPDTTADQMQLALQSVGFDVNEVQDAIIQLYVPPKIVIDPPTGLTVSCDYSSGALSASWQAAVLPAPLQGKEAVYNVALFTVQDQQTAICNVTNVTGTSSLLSLSGGQPLVSNQQYVARIQTVVDSLQSEWSAASAPVTYVMIAAPQQFDMLVGDSSTIILHWTPLNGAADMNFIALDAQNDMPLTPQPPFYFGGGGNQVKVDLRSISPDVITKFQIRGLFKLPTSDVLLPGPWSNAVTFARSPGKPQNLSCALNNNQFDVTWQMNSLGITSYIVSLLDASSALVWEQQTNKQSLSISIDAVPANAKQLQVAASSYKVRGESAQIPFNRQSAGWYQAAAQTQLRSMNIPVALSNNGKMWAYAGQYQNSVYSSSDGVSWTCVTREAPWAGRRSSAGVSFMGAIWLFGGDTVNGDANDVWVSPDGVNWKCATPNAPWGPRNGLCAVVFQNRMWVFGGRDHQGNTYNDVWASDNGAHWELITPQAGWSPRDAAAAVVYQNQIYMIGGSRSGSSLQEVWSTDNGRDWKPLANGNVPWLSRFDSKAVVLGTNLYLIGGTNSQVRGLSDMWVTQDGSRWEAVTQQAPWGARIQQGVTVFHDRIYLLGGAVNLISDSSVWYYTQ